MHLFDINLYYKLSNTIFYFNFQSMHLLIFIMSLMFNLK